MNRASAVGGVNNSPRQAININIKDCPSVKCEQCGNTKFDGRWKLKVQSALQSKTGRSETIKIFIFSCMDCGKIIDVRNESPALAQIESIKCSNCEHDIFKLFYRAKMVSALITGGKGGVAVIETYQCNLCGHELYQGLDEIPDEKPDKEKLS